MKKRIATTIDAERHGGASAAFLFRARNIHTLQHEDGWAIRRESGDRVLSVFSTQQEAIEKGREIAEREGVEHLIHGRDGRVRERNSYGKAPHPPRG